MPVQPESLEVLEKADVPPAQARAIVRAIELEIAGAQDTLATKHDVLGLQHEIGTSRGEMSQLGTTLRSEMSELGTTLRNEMSQLETTLRAEISKLETTLRSEISKVDTALRAEMATLAATLRGEMAALRGELKAEIHATGSSIVRQLYLAVLGQMAVMLGFAYFFATHLR